MLKPIYSCDVSKYQSNMIDLKCISIQMSKCQNIRIANRLSRSSDIVSWEPEGRYYSCTKSMVIVPFWFWMEHLWTALTPFWLSADDIQMIFILIYHCNSMDIHLTQIHHMNIYVIYKNGRLSIVWNRNHICILVEAVSVMSEEPSCGYGAQPSRAQ